MSDEFRFSSTYLFKIHDLKTSLDKAFDLALRRYTGVTLSQFMLLLAVAEHGIINQRGVAQFLGISPAAINRQVDIAREQHLLRIEHVEGKRGQGLVLTDQGSALVSKGVRVVEEHLATIFTDENLQTSLMGHIDLLLNHTKGVIGQNGKVNE